MSIVGVTVGGILGIVPSFHKKWLWFAQRHHLQPRQFLFTHPLQVAGTLGMAAGLCGMAAGTSSHVLLQVFTSQGTQNSLYR